MAEKAIRKEVADLAAGGPLPDTSSAMEHPERVEAIARALESLSPPVTDDEARVLVTLFGPDECFGLSWTLVHLIETAPSWPIRESIESDDNEWVVRLRSRADRAARP